MSDVFFALGSNIGDRLEHLKRALLNIKEDIAIELYSSLIYETAPWGKHDQNHFLNQVLRVKTEIATSNEVLDYVIQLETKLGRKRIEKWGPRVIDIDILFFNQEIRNSEHLTIPHPLIQNRRFILAPLAELAPEFIHPLLKKDMTELYRICLDSLEVFPLGESNLFNNNQL